MLFDDGIGNQSSVCLQMNDNIICDSYSKSPFMKRS